MGDCVSQIKKERPTALASNKIERLLCEEVMRVCAPREVDSLLITPQVVRVIVVCVILIEVAEPVVESLAIRDARRLPFAESPLAHEAGSVPGALENFCNRHILRAQRDSLILHISVAPDVSMAL